MPDTAELKKAIVTRDLLRGARNAVRTCLGIGPDDVVTVICDEASIRVAAAIREEIEAAGARSSAFILERHAQRPLAHLPSEIARSLERSTASVYTVHPRDGEFEHRRELIAMVAPCKLRHAHMIRITEDAMRQGMLSDYRRVAALNLFMKAKLLAGQEIRVTSASGTDVRVVLDPSEPIESAAGVIAPGEWSNLPNGEVYTVPSSVDGVYVCDGIAPSEQKLGSSELSRRPLRFDMKGGRLVGIEGGPGDLAAEILDAVKRGQNVDRVGMFAVGTNFEILMPIGDASQDMFMPGAYFSLGRPFAVGTSSWSSTCQLSFSGRKTSLSVGKETLVEAGRYPQRVLDALRV